MPFAQMAVITALESQDVLDMTEEWLVIAASCFSARHKAFYRQR